MSAPQIRSAVIYLKVPGASPRRGLLPSPPGTHDSKLFSQIASRLCGYLWFPCQLFVFNPPIKKQAAAANHETEHPERKNSSTRLCVRGRTRAHFHAHSSKEGPERRRAEQSSSRGIIPEEREEEWERKVVPCHSPHHSWAALVSGAGNEAGGHPLTCSHLSPFSPVTETI